LVFSGKGEKWKDTGTEKDSRKRGLETYSEYGLHGNGCLAGLGCLVRPNRDKSTEIPWRRYTRIRMREFCVRTGTSRSLSP